MKGRFKETPRMLPYVMQAITDLKDLNGSTTRKILDQINTAINLLNVKPTPRNVVMQVKKALRHAVDNGILKHKAGKYRLNMDCKPTVKDDGLKIQSRGMRTAKRHGRRRRSRRSSNRHHRRRRTMIEFRYSPSFTSGGSERSYASTTTDSYKSVKKSGNRRRRHKSLATKAIYIKRAATRKRDNRRKRKGRQPTPMPKEAKSDEIEETPPANEGPENNEQGDADPYANVEEPITMEVPPECDNPDCLCNLKQEPYEDSGYDNGGKSFAM
ncbi:hypothetical protein Trydic_g7379 [Trypoxylus dichotomus]